MRPITRNFLVGLLVVAALLLALGAVPSLLASGDPYYLTATPADPPADVTPVNGSTLSERRFPYTFAAIASPEGRSAAYYRGPLGLKGAFTHAPFDEMGAYAEQYPEAVTPTATYVRLENTTYRLTVTQAADSES
ncbi:hypothetical protein [Halosegnis sp.]|uniref:hypothetical protein n=1 Tax=Halosegnis sp. TaxID=2864959 RepID=UPI0035D4531E